MTTQADFDAMVETYGHHKPRWPNWWYGIGLVLILVALVALLNF